MNPITLYQQRLNLQDATFSRIEHEDAMVAVVYKVTLPNNTQLILKICTRANDYFREVYFLNHFAASIPVPRIIQVVPPEEGINGAILMEHLSGSLPTTPDFTETLAHEMGATLARIHRDRQAGYGDLIQPQNLSADPRVHFTQKFEEGFEECKNHLPKALLEQCRQYYDTNLHLLEQTDGPCIVHRDFRPGNVFVHEGKLQGVIDWASTRSGFAEEDFCPIEHYEWPVHSDIKKSFLAGYATIRPVPDYSKIMPLLRLSKAFATIGYTVKIGTWDTIHARVYQFNRKFIDAFFT
ncbi:MAG: aminoglycoside phosphotransferase family protein [Verrucomicrobia bacterium]|nr:aminoglycoside phosphotransferase family protein [Verrucomicrobiota bacterium]